MTSSNGNIFRVTGPLCGEFTGPGEFPAQRSVTRSFDVFFDLRLNEWMSKQPWGWWFETLSWSLWCHCNVDTLEQPSVGNFSLKNGSIYIIGHFVSASICLNDSSIYRSKWYREALYYFWAEGNIKSHNLPLIGVYWRISFQKCSNERRCYICNVFPIGSDLAQP